MLLPLGNRRTARSCWSWTGRLIGLGRSLSISLSRVEANLLKQRAQASQQGRQEQSLRAGAFQNLARGKLASEPQLGQIRTTDPRRHLKRQSLSVNRASASLHASICLSRDYATGMVSPAVYDTLAALTLLGVALLGAYAPVLLCKLGNKDKGSTRSLIYVLGNMLSAGVMISAGLVHLLGAAVKDLDPESVFPLAPFLCGLGFILTLVADHGAEWLSRKSGWSTPSCGKETGALPTSGTSEDGGSLQSIAILEESQGESLGGMKSAAEGPLASEEGSKDHQNHSNERSRHAFQLEKMQNGHHESQQPRGAEQERKLRQKPGSQDFEPLFGPDHISSAQSGLLHRSISNSSTGRSIETLAATLTAKAPEIKQVSFLTAVLMAVALSFHSLLEGMAMGAQESVVDTLHIFIAIFAHKGLAAYALGSSLVDSGATKRRFWTVIAVFSLATPAGIGLGRIVASFSESGPAAALSALASGTFLYVAFMEVIPKEMQNPEYGFVKLGMLCIGFGAMSTLAIWA